MKPSHHNINTMKSNAHHSKDLLQHFSPHQLRLIERAFFLGVMKRSRQQLPPSQKRNSKPMSVCTDVKESEENVNYSSYRNPLCEELLEYGIEVNFAYNDDIVHF